MSDFALAFGLAAVVGALWVIWRENKYIQKFYDEEEKLLRKQHTVRRKRAKGGK